MPLRKLATGFLEFQKETFFPKRAFFEELARKQQPKILMIACSDSRIDPAIITNAEPGDIFMVRNVANLVPPCERDGAKRGTSAALEFAIKSLEVEHVVVLGHVGCGGIQALLRADPGIAADNAFIHNWMNIADEARRRTLIIARDLPVDQQLRTLEREVIKTSLANLLTFPWIYEKLADKTLRMHGWYFDINDGQMYIYVPSEDTFKPLTLTLAADLQTL